MRPPENWRHARVTLGIAALTTLAWLLVYGAGAELTATYWAAFIPGRLHGFGAGETLAPFWLTPITATLVHGNLAHLLLNLLILLFCGRSVETILGPVGLIILYVVGAFAAAGAHLLVDSSDVVPMIGASGAISAVLGAYAIMFGRNKVKIQNPRLALWVHALWLAAAWVALQLMVGLTLRSAGVGIAIAAHIGGFFVGLLLAKPLLIFRYRKA